MAFVFPGVEMNPRIRRPLRDIQEVFKAGWDTCLTPEAQQAVHERIEKALEPVSTLSKDTSKSMETRIIEVAAQIVDLPLAPS